MPLPAASYTMPDRPLGMPPPQGMLHSQLSAASPADVAHALLELREQHAKELAAVREEERKRIEELAGLKAHQHALAEAKKVKKNMKRRIADGVQAVPFKKRKAGTTVTQKRKKVHAKQDHERSHVKQLSIAISNDSFLESPLHVQQEIRHTSIRTVEHDIEPNNCDVSQTSLG